MPSRDFLRNHFAGAAGILILLSAISLALWQMMGTAYIDLKIASAEHTTVEVFWTGENRGFGPRRSSMIQVTPNKERYKMYIGDLADITKLRFDPANSLTTLQILEFSIYQFGYEPIRLRQSQDFSRFKALQDIGELRASGNSLRVVTTGGDAQLQLELPAVEQTSIIFSVAWRTLLLTGLFITLLPALRRMTDDYRWVSYAMLVAVCLSVYMAGVSRINAHPDELMHLHAARYYVEHNTPPPVCNESTLHTYSPYGVSRLNTFEVAYFLTGKFAALTAFVPVADVLRLRYFNLLLFTILLILALKYPGFRVFCVPLIATPQVWYLFSYVNSEGLAIFATMVAAWQLLQPDSALRRLMQGVDIRRAVITALVLGGLLAAILLSKKNFYVFLLFAGLWFLGLAITERESIPVVTRIKRLLPLVATGLVLSGGWWLTHQSVNQFERVERISECRAQMARHAYAEDTPVEETRPTLFWRDKGKPFTALFDHHWGSQVFRSAEGVFGYMELQARNSHYLVAAGLVSALVLYIAYVCLVTGGAATRATFLLAVGMFVFVLAATMWKSWTRDFQPQGRYFFPLLPVIASCMAVAGSKLNPRIVSAFAMPLFLLGLYLFLFIGLEGIRRH